MTFLCLSDARVWRDPMATASVAFILFSFLSWWMLACFCVGFLMLFHDGLFFFSLLFCFLLTLLSLIIL